MLVGGQKVRSAARQELVSIRGIVPGEYTVNIYHFTAQSDQPVPVTVTVDKLNPRVTAVAKKTLDMAGARAERTAARFTLDAKGDVVSTSEVERSVLESFFDRGWNKGPR
jgi:hypothetical protein